MKSIQKILTLLFLGLSLLSYAQQFQLTNSDGVPYLDGQTIATTITEDHLDDIGEFVTHIFVKNLTDDELDVRTLRTNLELAEGMSAYVCYGVCAPDTLFALECTISENSSESYDLHLRVNELLGFCKFQLEFMVPGEMVTLFVEIRVNPIGIKEPHTTSASLSAYPNPAPANSTINVSYTLADKGNHHCLVIRNIMGAAVLSMPLNPYNNTISFDAAELKSGVYFYTIESNNQISVAKKLIVK
jgi:hypothetical protein